MHQQSATPKTSTTNLQQQIEHGARSMQNQSDGEDSLLNRELFFGHASFEGGDKSFWQSSTS